MIIIPDDVDGLARHAYSHGTTPLDWAAGYTENLIEVHLQVAASRAEDPATFPGYCIELTLAAVARRIVGTLMDAGWTAPQVLGDAEAHSRREAAVEAVAAAITESRQAHTDLGLFPPTDEALARVALAAIGGAR